MPPTNGNIMFLQPITEAKIINTIASLYPKLSSGFNEIPMKIVNMSLVQILLPWQKSSIQLPQVISNLIKNC